eukprot:scaffold6290_cov34-Attheya_sp.AAC.1
MMVSRSRNSALGMLTYRAMASVSMMMMMMILWSSSFATASSSSWLLDHADGNTAAGLLSSIMIPRQIPNDMPTGLLVWDLRGGGGVDADADERTSITDVTNSALVFVKPHANTVAVRSFVRSKLESMDGMTIRKEFDKKGPEIDRKKLIDQHYYAIASKATILSPKQVLVPSQSFQNFFGESWEKVLEEGRAVNALEACKRFGCDANTLDAAWREAESNSK